MDSSRFPSRHSYFLQMRVASRCLQSQRGTEASRPFIHSTGLGHSAHHWLPGPVSLAIARRNLLLILSQVVLVVKNPPANAGDVRDLGPIPGSGRPPGGRHGSALQHSRLESPMDRGAWRLQPIGSRSVRREATEHA